MKDILAILALLFLTVEAQAIPIPNEYVECRSVKPVKAFDSSKAQYVTTRVHDLGGSLGLVKYTGPIYTLKNTANGFQRSMPEKRIDSEVLNKQVLSYDFTNNSAAQLFHLEFEDPNRAAFPEEHLAGYVWLADGKAVSFSVRMNCYFVIPNH